ncbi:hypothetical protein ACHWQZ_G018164 [Mnemiopsis leidyi]
MSKISLKGIKSSYQRVKRLLSNPNDVVVEEEAVRTKPEIRHLGLQKKDAVPLPLHPTKEEDFGPDPFYDEINLSDQEDQGEQEEGYNTINRNDGAEGEEEYSYAVLDRCYNKKAPRVTPRPTAEVPVSSQYDAIDRSNSYSAASHVGDEEESYSLLHRIPGTAEKEEEEESDGYGHYDDISEFQGRMFLEEQNITKVSPQLKGNDRKSYPIKNLPREENQKSVHLELMAKIQDKTTPKPTKMTDVNEMYSSNLELQINQRRLSQQEELAAAVKKRFSTHIEEEIPIYAVANPPGQKKPVEKTYSNHLQLNSLVLDLTRRSGCLDKSSRVSMRNDFQEENDKEIEGLYDEDIRREGGDVLMDSEDYAIPYGYEAR